MPNDKLSKLSTIFQRQLNISRCYKTFLAMENYEKGILKDIIRQLEIISDRIENVHNGAEQELNEAGDYIQDAIDAVANVL